MSTPRTNHAPDGSDPEGRRLPVTIRIGPDGRVYFHDITAELLPVALALDPRNPEMKRRQRVCRDFTGRNSP